MPVRIKINKNTNKCFNNQTDQEIKNNGVGPNDSDSKTVDIKKII